ncbi:MAG: RraA family protein [Bryobacteraceae bacterium]
MTKTALFLLAGAMAWGQSNQPAAAPPPPSRQYLKVQQYTAEEDSRILKLYDGLRVADVIDGLDAVGLPEVTMMDRRIRPLWRDERNITHRIHGIALTMRLVPAQATAPRFKSHADERKWEEGEWGPPPEMLAAGSTDGYMSMGLIRPGTVLVVDGEAHDNGFCGSNVGLSMVGLGLRGLVGNAVCRDTDELALTRIPVYQDPMQAPRGINQGRMWVESYNEPVVVGGVLVMPGDVIVADNDGVAVVPRRVAEQVAEISRWIFEDDEVKRGKIYDSVGRPRDWTVQGHTEPPPASDKPIKQ